MAESSVLTSTSDGVALITLNRPDRLNALTPSMGREYVAALLAADADPAVRIAVVTGAGRGFCSGADLSILDQGPAALNAFVDGQTWDRSPTVALSVNIPVVMAVNGPAAGVGMVMALTGDVRFAAPDTRFISVFSQIGLIAEYGIAWLLPRIVGQGVAAEILLSGRAVGADEAYRLGLVTSVSDDPVSAAMEWAKNVAATCSPTSLSIMKSQLSAAAASDFLEAFDTSLALMSQSFARPDLIEALAAKTGKRAPVFPDRTV